MRLVAVSGILVALVCAAGCSDDSDGELCGGKACGSSERCCGPPACGFCVDKNSRIACPSSCADAAGVDATPGDGAAPSDGAAGQPCGGSTCGAGSFCCGPPACGFCAPNNSGVYCPSTCAEAGAG